MNNKHRRKNFTPSDDKLIREQPVSGIGLTTLGTMLRVSRERLMRRADELGVTLATGDDQDEAVDTTSLRDPLLERLKQVHGARK
ncbi:MAG TPA: hypothetical protein VFW91_20835 [Candidatus Binatia bacterium]|jgi:hypothetical protein|nr:hypothetical protein [Candidatus Binatia bacterium]